MPKKKTSLVLRKIIESVREGPKSIREIAKACGTNWESVRDHVTNLKEIGYVVEEDFGNKRVFSVVPENAPRDPETYFGLPLPERRKKEIDAIYAEIQSSWKKETGLLPGRIQAQKTLFRLVKTLKLSGIPLGWYLYGAVCVKPFDSGRVYPSGKIEAPVRTAISRIVKEYSGHRTATRVRLAQYREEGRALYLKKEEVLGFLGGRTLKRISAVNALLHDFLKNTPYIPDGASKDMLNDFVGLYLEIFGTLTEAELAAIRSSLITTFDELWKLVALYGYKQDLGNFYSREVLETYFSYEIRSQGVRLMEAMQNLREFLPAEEVDPKLEKFREEIGAK